MTGQHNGTEIGSDLLRQGAITADELASALSRHSQERTDLGRVLLTNGMISRLELYRWRAASWNLPFVDLVGVPPDPTLLEQAGPDRMLHEQWVPRSIDDGIDRDGRPTRVLTVAVTAEPTPELTVQLRELFGATEVAYSVTTDWDIERAVLSGCESTMLGTASEQLATYTPELSAKSGWWLWQKVALCAAVFALFVAAIADFRWTVVTAIVSVNLMFFIGVIFKLFLGGAGIRRVHEERQRAKKARAPERRMDDAELPTYTILVPAFRESNIIGKILEHLTTLDYPQSKLQILLLMEENDPDTIEAARRARPPECVRFVIVPKGDPQTKPKACNIGLALAEGEFLVIYDAEDRPEPDQLRSVLTQFRALPDSVICLQSRLNYFNAEENILTRMFTLEYSYWFDYMLPGLDSWRLPIPLGGTSNHFRVDKLRQLGGWDPYNVTEDADLGVRASAEGFTVGINDSTTWEEACSQWYPWIKQRTRWIKGYMVTALVHSRQPFKMWRTLGVRGQIGLLGLIAGTPAMFLACPPLWLFYLYTFLGGSVHGLNVPAWVLTATTFNLLIGNGSMMLLTMFAARRRGAYRLMPFALLLPVYWVLHSLAAWRALFHLLLKPDHWEKTPHGLVHGPPERAAAVTAA